MSELAVVRAQIKAWEREFRSIHGKDPSVADIKDQPHIAEKYKLYKKLTKAVAAASASKDPPASSSQYPSTPTRPPPSLIPKSRTVESVHPLPGFNPFSPVKNRDKGKAKDSLPSGAPQLPRKSSSFNPLATPTKSKPSRICHRTPSPHPFSSTIPANSKKSPRSRDRSTDIAVSRARKRLRGEPVSPSPSKHKRQRLTPQAVLPISKPESSSDSDDDTAHVGDLNTPFIDDSPAKAPPGGKSFKLLFDDVLPAPSFSKKTNESTLLSQNKCATLDTLFTRGPRDPFVRGSSRGDLSDTKSGGLPQVPPSGLSIKRGLDEGKHTSSGTLPIDTVHSYALLPPSPPPDDSGSSNPKPSNSKAWPSRKRLKVGAESTRDEPGEDEDNSSEGVAIKVVTQSRYKPSRPDADGLDWDPSLILHARRHDPIDANHHEPGTFSVDLPDQLRSVLAISPSRAQNSKEERVVRGLLYGCRVGHYDASRGGEIWDIGEGDDGLRGDTEIEEDWEGEPVPWEAGEL